MSFEKNYDLSGTQAWPTMFFTRHWSLAKQECPKIVALLQNMKLAQGATIDSGVAIGAKSAHGLYESDFDLFALPNESLELLVQFIRSSLALAGCVANGQEARPQDIQVEFIDSWYHITNEGGFHDAHVHHGCSWCGIFYLQLGSSGNRIGESAPNGGSRFYCPFHVGGSYRDYGNKYLTSSIDPPIEDGMLLLFPSYLLHSGLPYRGTENRVVVAFNARLHVTDGTPSSQAIAKKP